MNRYYCDRIAAADPTYSQRPTLCAEDRGTMREQLVFLRERQCRCLYD